MKTQYALTWRPSPASTILPSSLGSIPEKNKEGKQNGEETTNHSHNRRTYRILPGWHR
jgi:hypothetical protein